MNDLIYPNGYLVFSLKGLNRNPPERVQPSQHEALKLARSLHEKNGREYVVLKVRPVAGAGGMPPGLDVRETDAKGEGYAVWEETSEQESHE